MNNSPAHKRNLILDAAARNGLLRPRDLLSLGVDGSYLHRLVERGDLVRAARGLYRLPDADVTERHGLTQASKRYPKAVVCLLSAAHFHDLGTETPRRIWITLPRGSERPASGDLPLHISWQPQKNLQADMGIETHLIEGVPVRITSPARTLVDLFRARNKVGMDFVLEAFRDGLHRNIAMQEIHRFAVELKAEKALRPYLEALV